MGTFQTIEEARQYFYDDRFARINGMVIDTIGETEATCSLVLNENHMNANGGVMGGAIFTLADFAFAVAANQIHRPTVSQTVTMNYLNRVHGQKLFAHAYCIKNGRRLTVLNVDVTDDTGRAVAQYTGTGCKC
ncbi:MAG: PaaI family thioesterase [Catenisphaera adipataccumulans]|jgi:acyl-CoA thioesterase|uniref:PaaI family thioesterase n=1 Tax=Catenisphaera adipataccumulans TaxID=700500 RepID=UPI003D94334E